jgi:uncharacterized protein YndB with AHSA1/START domain
MAMSFSDTHSATMRVEHVDEPNVFCFTWAAFDTPDDDPRRTFVEFTLDAIETGTRLRVVETGFGQLPDEIHDAAYDAHVQGWKNEIDQLIAYVQAA